MNLDGQAVLPKANIPRTGTLMKMHQRRRAEERDRRQKSLRYKMRMKKQFDAYAVITKRKRTHKET
jgi:hypothetical protein